MSFIQILSNKTSASIEVISGTTEEMTLTVYDNVGRVALASTHTLTVGTNTVMVGTENLSSVIIMSK
ncbi:MAG: hypothetical protein IPN86_10360 [Saprospiraceae bacterium]|nr:hypothetical protein [Saprospiraceae bacterium]